MSVKSEFIYYTKGFIFLKDGDKVNRTLDSDDETAYAKGNGKLFYVKSVDGQLYNPYTMEYKKRKIYKWRPVSPEVFDLYVRFLKTGRTSQYLKAERQV